VAISLGIVRQDLTDGFMSPPKDTRVITPSPQFLGQAECTLKRKKSLLPVRPEPETSRSAVQHFNHLATKQPHSYLTRRKWPFSSTRGGAKVTSLCMWMMSQWTNQHRMLGQNLKGLFFFLALIWATCISSAHVW